MKKNTPKLGLNKETVKTLTLPKDAVAGMSPTTSDQCQVTYYC